MWNCLSRFSVSTNSVPYAVALHPYTDISCLKSFGSHYCEKSGEVAVVNPLDAFVTLVLTVGASDTLFKRFPPHSLPCEYMEQ